MDSMRRCSNLAKRFEVGGRVAQHIPDLQQWMSTLRPFRRIAGISPFLIRQRISSSQQGMILRSETSLGVSSSCFMAPLLKMKNRLLGDYRVFACGGHDI